MALIELHADLSRTAKALERIADVLTWMLHIQIDPQYYKRKAAQELSGYRERERCLTALSPEDQAEYHTGRIPVRIRDVKNDQPQDFTGPTDAELWEIEQEQEREDAQR